MKKLIILLLFLPIISMAQTYRPTVDAGTLQGLDSTDFVRTTAANRVIGQGTAAQVLTTDGAGTLTWTTLAASSGIVGVDATNLNSVKFFRQSDTISESFRAVYPEYALKSNVAYGTQGFSDSVTVIPCTQNVYSVVTGQYGRLFRTGVYKNVNFVGDSIQVLKTGDYVIHQSLSYQGANSDNYHIALFVNGVEAEGFGETERDMTTSNIGASSAMTILSLNAMDWITLRIKNTANNNDATINAGNIVIEKK